MYGASILIRRVQGMANDFWPYLLAGILAIILLVSALIISTTNRGVYVDSNQGVVSQD